MQTQHLYILSFFLFFTPFVFGQICDGELGENIFTEGDFGSGTANIIPTDPQIAPGYIYTAGPPDDGFYTITNHIAPWPYDFGWLQIGDNSSDPNGYMMVVNASFSPGLFYEQEIDGLCENTLYVFSADIINLIQAGVNIIKPNVSFLIDNVVVYETGNIPESEQWNTYGFIFTTAPGQTSVTLSLRNNAPGGIGNDIALDNISFRPCGPEVTILPLNQIDICEDGMPIDIEALVIGNQYDTPAYQWQESMDNGVTWTDIAGANDSIYTHTNLSAGVYYYHCLLANDLSNLGNPKCRVISDVKIINVVPKFYSISDTICDGTAFQLGNNFYNTTGIYTDSLLTYIGCDSIVTLDLTVIPDTGIEAFFSIESPICSYDENGAISLDSIVNGVAPISIFIDDIPDADGNISGLEAGTYTYLITDRYGCSFETDLMVESPIPFVGELGPDLNIQLGDYVVLNPNLNQATELINWQAGDQIDCAPNCTILNFAPPSSMQVQMTAISLDACVFQDSVNINVEVIRNVYIPNIFSPNYDGRNDYFTVFAPFPNVQVIEELMILDRWGEQVFSGTNLPPNETTAGWDGTFRGKRMQKGVYIYLAKVRFLDGAVLEYAGDLTLIR